MTKMPHPKRCLALISCLILVGVVYFQGKLSLSRKQLTQGGNFLDVTLKDIRTANAHALKGEPPTEKSESSRKTSEVTAPPQNGKARYSIIKNNERFEKYLKQESIELTEEAPGATTEYTHTINRVTGNTRKFTADFERHLADDDDEHEARVEQLRSTCRDLNLHSRPLIRKSFTDFFYSRKNNFAYCKVPKSGSTLWMKLFMALVKGDNYTRAMKNLPRAEFHKRSKLLISSPSRIISARVPTIVVSRNPYTRLYSAYVDKVYLPLFWDQCKNMQGVFTKEPYFHNYTKEVLKGTKSAISGRLLRYRENLRRKGLLIPQNISHKITPVCANDVTFEQFLYFIVSSANAHEVLEPHWAPISTLCQPCRLNTYRIVRQESFSKDVEHVLKSVNLDLQNFPTIREALYEDRASNTIPGIVGVVNQWAHSRNVNSCINHTVIIQRVWKSLQIQGFIRDSEALPESLRTDTVFRNKKVLDAILDNIQNNPLTSEERNRQRHSHLVDAYRSVRKEIIEQIQEIYRHDFMLFNYSTIPPV